MAGSIGYFSPSPVSAPQAVVGTVWTGAAARSRPEAEAGSSGPGGLSSRNVCPAPSNVEGWKQALYIAADFTAVKSLVASCCRRGRDPLREVDTDGAKLMMQAAAAVLREGAAQPTMGKEQAQLRFQAVVEGIALGTQNLAFCLDRINAVKDLGPDPMAHALNAVYRTLSRKADLGRSEFLSAITGAFDATLATQVSELITADTPAQRQVSDTKPGKPLSHDEARENEAGQTAFTDVAAELNKDGLQDFIETMLLALARKSPAEIREVTIGILQALRSGDAERAGLVNASEREIIDRHAEIHASAAQRFSDFAGIVNKLRGKNSQLADEIAKNAVALIDDPTNENGERISLIQQTFGIPREAAFALVKSNHEAFYQAVGSEPPELMDPMSGNSAPRPNLDDKREIPSPSMSESLRTESLGRIQSIKAKLFDKGGLFVPSRLPKGDVLMQNRAFDFGEAMAASRDFDEHQEVLSNFHGAVHFCAGGDSWFIDFLKGYGHGLGASRRETLANELGNLKSNELTAEELRLFNAQIAALRGAPASSSPSSP